jgi:hypothetical protein
MGLCGNFRGTSKLVVLKMSVGLLVLQSLLEQLLAASGTLRLRPAAGYSAEAVGLRLYCKCSLSVCLSPHCLPVCRLTACLSVCLSPHCLTV